MSYSIKALLIVNLHAGKKITKDEILKIKNSLEKKNCIVNVYCTKSKKDATEAVLRLAHDFDVLICCGGDGTFHEVLNGILKLNTQIPVAFIPFGTTNDLAKSLKLPLNINDFVKKFSIERAAYQDVGFFNEKEYFSYVASFGAFCEVAYSTPQKFKNFFGKIAYIFEGLRCVRKIKPYKVKIICDEEIIEENFVFGAITNSCSVAGILELKSEGIKFDDGKLELLLLKEPKNVLELIKMLLDLRKNKFNGNLVILKHSKNIELELEAEVPFTLDGEYAGDFSCIKINCKEKAFKIIK